MRRPDGRLRGPRHLPKGGKHPAYSVAFLNRAAVLTGRPFAKTALAFGYGTSHGLATAAGPERQRAPFGWVEAARSTPTPVPPSFTAERSLTVTDINARMTHLDAPRVDAAWRAREVLLDAAATWAVAPKVHAGAVVLPASRSAALAFDAFFGARRELAHHL